MPSQEYNLVHVLRLLKKWKKHILIIPLAAGILTALFSWFFLKDYYLSAATIYPINMGYTDRSIMFNTEGATDVAYFGTKEDVGRVLSIANSADIKQYIISKYELSKVYEIDTTQKYWRTKVTNAFEGNYKAIKTEQGAIEISILDTDPKRAKEIVDDVILKIDEVNRKSINDNKEKQYELFSKQITEQQAEVEKYADTLGILAKKHNIKIHAAGESETVDGNDPVAAQQFKVIYDLQKDAILRLSTSVKIQGQIKTSIEASATSISILEKSYESDRKEKPKRSVIVLLAVFLTLTVSVFGALALEEIKEIRSQL